MADELPVKNALYYLKLGTLTSFLLLTLSYLILALKVEYNTFLTNTFLSQFIYILNYSVFSIIITIMNILSWFILVGCLISTLIYTYYDYGKGILLK